jgi:hypothetical protein
VREVRKHYVNVRFSESEYENLATLMRLAGYRNRSKFIRESLLSTRCRRRNLSRNEANLSKQIELLRAEIRRVGVNYNQRVKTLNTLAKFRDRQGRMIVSATDIEHDMTDMKRMMDAMVSKVSLIEKEVTDFIRLNSDDESSSGDSSGKIFESKDDDDG